MRLKTTTQTIKDAIDACRDALIRGGFEPWINNSRWMRLGGDNPGEVYEAWFPSDGFLGDCFFRIQKGTAGPKNSIGSVDWDWDFSNTIKLRLV